MKEDLENFYDTIFGIVKCRLENIYCTSCRSHEVQADNDEYKCSHEFKGGEFWSCHRKYIGWQPSHKLCGDISKEIIAAINRQRRMR